MSVLISLQDNQGEGGIFYKPSDIKVILPFSLLINSFLLGLIDLVSVQPRVHVCLLIMTLMKIITILQSIKLNVKSQFTVCT